MPGIIEENSLRDRYNSVTQPAIEFAWQAAAAASVHRVTGYTGKNASSTTTARMIARIVITTLLLLALANACAETEVARENPAVSAVLTLQDQLHQFAIAGDAASFGALISEEFVASDPSNTIRHRDELVALVSSGRLQYESIETSIDYARQLGDDLVVIMGTESTLQSSVPANGELESVALSQMLKRRFTNVYRNENGTWRLLIKQSTIIALE